MNESELASPIPQPEVRDPRQLVMFFSFALLMLGFSAVWILFHFSHIQILAVGFALVFFAMAFFSIRLGLVLMAISMLFSPEFSVGSVGIREISIRIEDVLIPILSLAWLAQVTIRRQWGMFVWTPLNKPILLLIILSIISTARGSLAGWVLPLDGAFYIFKTLEFFSIYFLTVNYVREERQIKYFLFFVLLIACFLGFYTLRQVPSTQIFSANRITAPFEGAPEPATVGGYMAFLLFLIFGLFLFENRRKTKWLYGILGLILFPSFLLTLNRTSYLVLAVGFIYIALMARKKWLIFLLAGVFLSSPIWAPHRVKERVMFTFEDAKNPGRILGVDYSFQERILLWRRMWKGVKYSPVIGLGVTSWQTPDSQWARTIHEIGFVGLGLWLWILLRLYKISRWLFNLTEQGMFKGFALGYCAAVIGLFFHGFGSITFYIVRIMEPFWFVTGLIISLYHIRISQDADFAMTEAKSQGMISVDVSNMDAPKK